MRWGLRERERSGIRVQANSVGTVSDRWSWSKMAPLPTARTAMATAVVRNKIYVIGGINGRGQTIDHMDVYDPATDRWEAFPPLLQPRHHASAVALGHTIIVSGGYVGTNFIPQADVFVFDTLRGHWEKSISLPEPRAAHGSAVVGRSVYVVGGVTPSGVAIDGLYFRQIEQSERELLQWREWDWDRLPSLAQPREHAVVVAIGQQILVFGGKQTLLASTTASSEVLHLGTTPAITIFYPSRIGVWQPFVSLPTARSGACGGVMQHMVVVCGGETTNGPVSIVEAYDMRRNRWLQLPSLSTARHDAVAAVVNDAVYVIGGSPTSGLSMCANNEKLTMA